jgi:hypothetical protein
VDDLDEREAWIDLPDDDTVRQRMGPGWKFRYDLGAIPAMSRLIVAHPEIGQGFMGLTRQVMYAPGFLDLRERQMVAAVAAAAQDCRY